MAILTSASISGLLFFKSDPGIESEQSFPINLNEGQLNHLAWFNTHGTLVRAELGLVLIHELEHAVAPDRALDPGAAQNYKPSDTDVNQAGWITDGPAVKAQNAVAVQINDTDARRVSYYGGVRLDNPGNEYFVPGRNYTDGATIDSVRIGANEQRSGMTGRNIDESTHGNQRNLIFGTGSDDTITTALGNDWIYGGQGNDTVHGGKGDDHIWGDDRFDLSKSGDDTLYGDEGNDFIDGGKGADHIFGGAGTDRLIGGAGDDTILGEAGVDTIDGDDGNDTVDGGNGNDVINGGSGDDVVHGGAGNDFIHGDGDNDVLFGDAGNDFIYGDGGSDTIDGGAGVNVLDGGDGRDYLIGGANDDTLYGGSGNDTLQGGGGVNRLEGGLGSDTLLSEGAGDILNGGPGNDILELASRQATIEFHTGDGSDVVQFDLKNSDYTLKLTDLNPDDIDVIGGGFDVYYAMNHTDPLKYPDGEWYQFLTIRAKSTGDQITFLENGLDGVTNIGPSSTKPLPISYNKGYYQGNTTLHCDQGQLDTIQFADGSSWDQHAIWDHLSMRDTWAYAQSDNVHGYGTSHGPNGPHDETNFVDYVNHTYLQAYSDFAMA